MGRRTAVKQDEAAQPEREKRCRAGDRHRSCNVSAQPPHIKERDQREQTGSAARSGMQHRRSRDAAKAPRRATSMLSPKRARLA
jgi:hypothetical protein